MGLPRLVLNKPVLIICKCGEQLSTTFKVVSAICYKRQNGSKKHIFGNLRKFFHKQAPIYYYYFFSTLHPSKSWEKGVLFQSCFSTIFCLSLAKYKIFTSTPSGAKIMPTFASLFTLKSYYTNMLLTSACLIIGWIASEPSPKPSSDIKADLEPSKVKLKSSSLRQTQTRSQCSFNLDFVHKGGGVFQSKPQILRHFL